MKNFITKYGIVIFAIALTVVAILALTKNGCSQTVYEYRLQFDNVEQARALEDALTDSTAYGSIQLSIVGHGYFQISPQQIDSETGDTIPAVIDTKYSASVLTNFFAPELMPYVVDVPYWGHNYLGGGTFIVPVGYVEED